MSPLLRSVAVGVVERLGEQALSAWRDLTAALCVGPHARAMLAAWDRVHAGEGPGHVPGADVLPPAEATERLGAFYREAKRR